MNLISYYKKIKNRIKTIFKILLCAFCAQKIRIEEIDVSNKLLIVRSPGVRTILKIPINKAISDPNILGNLTSLQAAWLGYYFSLAYESNYDSSLMLTHRDGKYKILSLDRHGYIVYLNVHLKTSNRLTPAAILQNREILSGFDPSQACYIGVLAGLDSISSKPKQGIVKNPKTKLYLVQ